MPKEKEQAKKRTAAEAKEQATATTDEDGDANMDLPDDAPTAKMRRHKKRKLDDWTKEIVRSFAEKKGAEIKAELQSETPDFAKIEKIFAETNREIQNANEQHGAPIHDNLLPDRIYRANHEAWTAKVNSDSIDPESGWRAYDQLCGMFRATNSAHNLPEDWIIPSDWTQKRFGDRPANIAEADPDTDSAYGHSDGSKSEESDSDEPDGINELESRMLSRGKVLYWWRVGTGTQIFVRYGTKERPVYRVRAGSSQPYDQQTTEQVHKTRGSRNYYDEERNKLIWEYGRNQVLDIIGVGWKISKDNEVDINPLALIRPSEYASYPHTRVLVRWKDRKISLETRGFVRRIVHGGSMNGDRIIYLRAKGLEKAYRGYDIEEDNDENTKSDGGTSDRPSTRRAHSARSGTSSRHQRGVLFEESESEESDTDSETSQSRPRRVHDRKTKSSNNDRDIDTKIRQLSKALEQLKVEKERSSRERTLRQRNRRRRD